jgi:hypothetical protein
MKAWMMTAALALMLAAGLTVSAGAQTHGGTGVLKIKPGARATGMGQAGVALPQRALSIWWNPALLAQNQGREVSSTIAKLVPDLADDVYYLNLGGVTTLEGWGGVGLDIMYLSYGQTEAVNEEGQSFGYFSSYELVPTLGFGTRLVGDPDMAWGESGKWLEAVDVGLSLKYVWVDLAPGWAMEIVGEKKDGQASAVAADFGALMQGSVSGIAYAIGANVQNLGTTLVYIDADAGDPLPRNLKAGIAVQFYHSDAVTGCAVFDYNKSLIVYEENGYDVTTNFGLGEMKELLNMGAEVSIKDRINARLGYVSDPEGEIQAMTYGVGLDLPLSGGTKLLRFDYSSVPQALDLDRVHYLSLGVLFQ